MVINISWFRTLLDMDYWFELFLSLIWFASAWCNGWLLPSESFTYLISNIYQLKKLPLPKRETFPNETMNTATHLLFSLNMRTPPRLLRSKSDAPSNSVPSFIIKMGITTWHAPFNRRESTTKLYPNYHQRLRTPTLAFTWMYWKIMTCIVFF